MNTDQMTKICDDLRLAYKKAHLKDEAAQDAWELAIKIGYMAAKHMQLGESGVFHRTEFVHRVRTLLASARAQGEEPYDEWDRIAKKEMWDMIQEVRKIASNDGTESLEDTVRHIVETGSDSIQELLIELEERADLAERKLEELHRDYQRQMSEAGVRGEEMRVALEKIRDRKWVENALDPQWAASVARAALATPAEGPTPKETDRELLAWTLDQLVELNPSNYSHSDVCFANDKNVEVILAIKKHFDNQPAEGTTREGNNYESGK